MWYHCVLCVYCKHYNIYRFFSKTLWHLSQLHYSLDLAQELFMLLQYNLATNQMAATVYVQMDTLPWIYSVNSKMPMSKLVYYESIANQITSHAGIFFSRTLH